MGPRDYVRRPSHLKHGRLDEDFVSRQILPLGRGALIFAGGVVHYHWLIIVVWASFFLCALWWFSGGLGHGLVLWQRAGSRQHMFSTMQR